MHRARRRQRRTTARSARAGIGIPLAERGLSWGASCMPTTDGDAPLEPVRARSCRWLEITDHRYEHPAFRPALSQAEAATRAREELPRQGHVRGPACGGMDGDG